MIPINSNKSIERHSLAEHNISDLECVKKINRDDATAFSLLFHRYYEILYRFAGRMVGDAQVAENIVQDVFVKIWQNRKTLTIKSNVKAYLYTSVKNHSLNVLKHEKYIVPENDDADSRAFHNQTPEQDLLDKELYSAVHQAIDKLPRQCRRIYIMKRYDELRYAEIAEILNISINTVKTQMKRALKALHKNLSYLINSIIGI